MSDQTFKQGDVVIHKGAKKSGHELYMTVYFVADNWKVTCTYFDALTQKFIQAAFHWRELEAV